MIEPTKPQAPNVLLSIKPEHANAILDGEKLWEYRKTAPARGMPMRLVLYASAPTQAVLGDVWTWTKRTDAPEVLIEETIESTPHDPADIYDYFGDVETGTAIRSDAYRRFETPIPRTELEAAGVAPAQNFRYLDSVVADPEQISEGLNHTA